MNKIVINTCYGGFGLSEKALKMFSDIKGLLIIDNYTLEAYPRHGKDLVRVVEKLGEDSWGDSANLQVFEIKGNAYKILTKDGKETVEVPMLDGYIMID